MAVIWRATGAGGGTSGTGNRSTTIAAVAGDLLIVFVQWSGNSATNPTCTDSGDAGAGAYALIGTVLNNGSADIQAVFARTTAVTNTATLTVTPVVGSGTNTAGQIVIIACSGATNFGASAIRSGQFGKQENQTTGVPTPVLPASALTGNMTIMSSGSSGTGTLTVVPNASWAERSDAQQSNPVTALEVNTRDSGFTGTSAAYVSIVSALWNSTIIELDGAVNVSVTPTGGALAVSRGTPTLTGDANVSPSGGALTASRGTPSIAGGASVSPTGGALAIASGSPSISGGANVSPTGLQLTIAFGTPTILIPDVTVFPTGLGLTIERGAPSISGDANVAPEGMAMVIAIGTPAVTGGATVMPIGIALVISRGTPTVTIGGGAGGGGARSRTPLGLRIGI